MTKPELSQKQAEFCRQYMQDFNGTQAAIRAGYSANGADVTAIRLLGNPRVRVYLDELAPEVTSEMIAAEWERIAFYDPSRVYSVDEHGVPRIDFSNATPDDLALIAEVSNEIQLDSEGKRIQKAKVKLHSKEAALKNLGEIKGLYRTRVTVTTVEGEQLTAHIFAALAEYYAADQEEFAKVAQFIRDRMPS